MDETAVTRRGFLTVAAGASASLMHPQFGLTVVPGQAAVAPAGSDAWVNTAKYKKKPPYRIALFASYLEGTWMSTYAKHIEYEGQVRQKDLISELRILNASTNIAKQVADVKDILARGIDGIILDPLSPTALVPVCRDVMRRDIPLVISKN